jgi:hypothetical protein
MPGHTRRQRAMVSAARSPTTPHPATCSDAADAPEKRKVGGSTPPLTTSPEQTKRPGGFLRPGRLTATLPATVSFGGLSGLGQRVAQLAERPALLVKRSVGVDRHRDLDVAVADDLPDHIGRNAEVERSETQVCLMSWNRVPVRPAAVRIRLQLRRRLSGSIGVPIRVGKMSPFSCQFGQRSARSVNCCRRCSRRAWMHSGGSGTVRAEPSVLGRTNRSAPLTRWSVWTTSSVPASRSMSSQRRPSSSPLRRPRHSART